MAENNKKLSPFTLVLLLLLGLAAGLWAWKSQEPEKTHSAAPPAATEPTADADATGGLPGAVTPSDAPATASPTAAATPSTAP